MHTYQPWVDGHEVRPTSWTHALRASAVLDDAFGAIALKRGLDRGAEPPTDDDRVVARVGLADETSMAEALAAARRDQPAWAEWPLRKRLEVGYAVNAEIARRFDDFVDVLVTEGHPRRLAQWEVTGVVSGSGPGTLDAQAATMETTFAAGGRDLRLVRKPDGVVCLAPPRNAAASTSVLGLLALVAGNTLVMKAPRSTPFGVTWIWRDVIEPVLRAHDVPPGVVAVLCGDPEEFLDQWLTSDDVDDLMYFGSSSRGIELERRCVEHGKKPVLELAGNDAVLVWSDAELDLAAAAAAECFYGSAQICMVPKQVVVHPVVADRFVERLVAAVADVRPGRPEDDDVLLTPVLKAQDFFEVLDEATAAGATVVTGGERTDENGRRDPSGVFLEPTVLRVEGLATARELRAVREETFFPLLPVVVAEPGEDLLDRCLTFLETNPYGLRNSLWGQDPDVVEHFCALRNGGLLKVNDSHIGFVDGLPTHGGTGLTGGVFGECNFPMLRTSHLQGISVATAVQPRSSVFDSAGPVAQGGPA